MNIKSIIRCILIFIFSFAFISNVHAEDITLESVTLDYKSEEVSIVNDPIVDKLTIKFDVSFKNVGDFVKYKIIINNQSNEDYEIRENSSLNNSNYISYVYSYDEENNIAEKNKKTVMYIVISYKNDVPNNLIVNGFYNETNNLILDLGEQIKNPNTGRKIIISVILIVTILVLSLILFRLKRNKRFMFILLTSLLLIPTSIYAYGVLHIKIESNIQIEKEICESFATDSWDMIANNVSSGNTSCYNVGDTKEVDMGTFGTHTLRIANKSTPTECRTPGFSQTACGFVVEFADIITTHSMNTTDSNVGGWPASEMRTYVNEDIYNALPNDLKNIIIDTRVVSGYGSNDSSNFISIDKMYLLCYVEIYGNNDNYADQVKNTETRQLDYYSGVPVTSSSYSGAIKQRNGSNIVWWSRSANPGNRYNFRLINSNGVWNYEDASISYGISPAFRVGIELDLQQ